MKFQWMIFAFLLMLSGCKAETSESLTMSTKSEAMTTHCVGRNLINLPSAFVESPVATGIFKLARSGGGSEPIDVVVNNGKFTNERFQSEVQKRRLELERPHLGGGNVLRVDKKLSDGSNLFRVQEIEDSYVSEVMILRGASMIRLRLESFHDEYLKAEEDLIALSAQIRANDIASLSQRNEGFCLGAISLTAKFSLESGSFLFRDGKGSSYGIEIDTYAKDSQPPLLARMSGPDSLLTLFDVKHKVLRARERTAAGMQAQEWLGWGRTSDDPEEKTLKFALDTVREKPGRTTPSIRLSFDTAQPLEDGTRPRTSISDDDAIQQWDAVVASIRPAGI